MPGDDYEVSSTLDNVGVADFPAAFMSSVRASPAGAPGAGGTAGGRRVQEAAAHPRPALPRQVLPVGRWQHAVSVAAFRLHPAVCAVLNARFAPARCQICFGDYDDGDQLRMLPCFHDYHVACIDRWLRVSF